jgi:hypothetical protein
VSGAPPDVILGQADPTSTMPNRGGAVAANTLSSPSCVHWDGSKLFVCDRGNHRVLVYDGWPTASGAPASVVIGQPDMAAGAVNNGGRSARSLNMPTGLVTVGGRVYLSDSGNHRVLRFNTIPTANGQAADAVHGQPDFMSGAPNQGGLGAGTLSLPAKVSLVSGRLAIGDAGNDRVVLIPPP